MAAPQERQQLPFWKAFFPGIAIGYLAGEPNSDKHVMALIGLEFLAASLAGIISAEYSLTEAAAIYSFARLLIALRATL